MKQLIALILGGVLCGNSVGSEKADYVLHEWGTFTTVSGSDGVILTGLEREEEHLPGFVYAHRGMENGTLTDPGDLLVLKEKGGIIPVPNIANLYAFSKGRWQRNLRNVTVKMETPVIYFYTDEELSVDVEVGFKGGSISQWFPHRSSGEAAPKITRNFLEKPVPGKEVPPIQKQEEEMGLIDFAKGYEGRIQWEVDVLPREKVDPVKLFRSGETPSWIYPKVPNSAVVRNALGEHEDYLFYRGVGNFSQPVITTVDSENRLIIRNKSEGKVPFGFVFENQLGSVRYKILGEGVDADGILMLEEKAMVSAQSDWKEEVYVAMRDGLVRAGLYPEEADGMVRTWWKSYFETDGLRVFWIVPEAETNRILPMKVSPEPKEIVRVIVGRTEVLRPSFERELVQKLTSDRKEDAGWKTQYLSDRFGLAYQKRVEDLQKLADKGK